MAVSSKMRELGSALPSFSLPNTITGEIVTDAFLRGNGPSGSGPSGSGPSGSGPSGSGPSVVAFICNHCPFVVHIRSGLVEFGRYARDAGVPFVAISSNDIGTHPQDGPEQMAAEAQRHGFPFPYLYDESQDVAREFDAACTPDFYVFDARGLLAYRGQFDDARPSNQIPVTGKDLRAAVDALLSGKAPTKDQRPSIGCGIKWKR